MRRTTLFLIAIASAVVCGAWGAHASPSSSVTKAFASASRFPPVPSPTSSRKIDEYGNLLWRDEKARLDNIAIEVRNSPRAIAYLVCYGGRRARVGEARRRCARAAGYLVTTGGIEASRVSMMDGGFREDLSVELWVLPMGSSLPTASPTVDPSEVTIIGDAPRRKRASRVRRFNSKRAPTRRRSGG